MLAHCLNRQPRATTRAATHATLFIGSGMREKEQTRGAHLGGVLLFATGQCGKRLAALLHARRRQIGIVTNGAIVVATRQ